ncbi:MAG TPA: AAA family ATPase [Devosia sp.]|nr:AAA family ATPase [Devosia sp.]
MRGLRVSELEPAHEADFIEGVDAPELSQNLIGHQETFDLLVQQLAQGRLPGGILLHGPKGIGKATFAFALARKILLETGDETSERINDQICSGSHPNLYILRRVPRERGVGFYNDIRVDEVRTILRKLHQTRGKSGNRILIVDSVDECNANAANALLKTLEEPPADTQIILVSHRPLRLLPTIRSRCQAHALRTLSDDQVRDVLKDKAATEDALNSALVFAKGRPRRGFEALGINSGGILGDLTNWLKGPAQGDIGQMLGIAEALANKKNSMEAAFAREIILDWIAGEARGLALQHGQNSSFPGAKDAHQRLASANQLWERRTLCLSKQIVIIWIPNMHLLLYSTRS